MQRRHPRAGRATAVQRHLHANGRHIGVRAWRKSALVANVATLSRQVEGQRRQVPRPSLAQRRGGRRQGLAASLQGRIGRLRRFHPVVLRLRWQGEDRTLANPLERLRHFMAN
ncbi:hypothetical protein D3C78_1278110 [compost metagenome]